MGNCFLLQGRPGLEFWYGRETQDVRRIFFKNIDFFARVYDVCTHSVFVGPKEVRILFEGDPQDIGDFCRHLILHVNRQLQHGSAGINIFSGGLQLHRLKISA